MDSVSLYAVMYLEINLISVLLVGIIRYKTNGLSKMVAQRNFTHAINSQVLFFLSDTFYVLMKCGLLPYEPAAVIALKSIYFFSTALMCFFWFVYFEHLQGSAFIKSRRVTRASSALVCVMGLLLVINLFTGILFYVDDGGVYRRGRLFILQYLLSYIYVFAACTHALFGIFDKKKQHIRKTLVYLALFPIAPAGAGIVQFVRPELPLACAALSLATLIMYLNWTDEMISLDPLTKLNNRKQLIYYYEQWQQQENAGPLCLMMIDANKFKSINDTYGHVQGDAALVRIANALLISCEHSGVKTNIARFGGDEFTVLVHSADERLLEGLAKSISDNTVLLNKEAGVPYELSVSIGFSAADSHTDFNTLVATADERLYEQKRGLTGEK